MLFNLLEKRLYFLILLRDSLLFPINYQFPSELQLVIPPPSCSLLSLDPAKLKLIKSCQQIITAVCGAPESYFHYPF